MACKSCGGKKSKGVKSAKKGATIPTSVKKNAVVRPYEPGVKRVIILNGEYIEINV